MSAITFFIVYLYPQLTNMTSILGVNEY